jgi:hypothetical protein
MVGRYELEYGKQVILERPQVRGRSPSAELGLGGLAYSVRAWSYELLSKAVYRESDPKKITLCFRLPSRNLWA